jgi:uncharacterized protein (TIGR02266 family)
MPTSESRAFPRINLQLEVSFDFAGERHEAFTRNISRGGAFIQTPTPVDVGEPLRLSLLLPGVEDPLDIHARVVWVNTPQTKARGKIAGMGVKFVAADASDLALLESPLSWV